jgi:hypothetical protein
MSNLKAVKEANRTGNWGGVTGGKKQSAPPPKEPKPAKPSPPPKG